MGQIVFAHPGGQAIQVTGSTVPLMFDPKTPVTYPQAIRQRTVVQAPGGPATLSFADGGGNSWQVAVIVPTTGDLYVDTADAAAAATSEATVDGGTP